MLFGWVGADPGATVVEAQAAASQRLAAIAFPWLHRVGYRDGIGEFACDTIPAQTLLPKKTTTFLKGSLSMGDDGTTTGRCCRRREGTSCS
jgi:hypothetical protein